MRPKALCRVCGELCERMEQIGRQTYAARIERAVLKGVDGVMGERPHAGVRGARWEIARGSKGYPTALEAIPRPPDTLYGVGDLDALTEGLSVVGARRATPYGRNAAKLFAGMAAKRGIAVISGGALGCDSCAHEAALSAGGKTVAFLGGGCNRPYPVRNVGLFQRIVDAGGAVVSEHPWDFPPVGYTFRERNRLIAGLGRATLIVEAGLPSGTFSTADEALAANRDVLAVPGSIFSPTSRGANALISQGAYPVVDEASFSELLDRLFPETRTGQLAFEMPQEHDDPMLAALAADPLRLEQMVEMFADDEEDRVAAISRLMTRIVRLEGEGVIERFPDGRFGVTKMRPTRT